MMLCFLERKNGLPFHHSGAGLEPRTATREQGQSDAAVGHAAQRELYHEPEHSEHIEQQSLLFGRGGWAGADNSTVQEQQRDP